MLQEKAYYLLVQFGHHLLQLLVSLLQVLLSPLESIQFSLRAAHLLLHPPAQLITHCRHQRRTDRILTNGGITTGTWVTQVSSFCQLSFLKVGGHAHTHTKRMLRFCITYLQQWWEYSVVFQMWLGIQNWQQGTDNPENF